MTDVLRINMEAVSLIASISIFVLPVICLGWYLVGRWAAYRWYQKNAHEFATNEVADRWRNAVGRIAEKDREIEGLQTMLDGREARIKELVAIVRAAQVQGVKQTEILTMITGQHTPQEGR